MSSQILTKAVGIDLGTTNSAVAVMNPTDTEIILHKDANTKSETTPSCVWKDPKTGKLVVGRLAFRRLGTRPEPIRSIKRLMGRQTRVRLTNEDVTPEQVSAFILSEMKRQIEEDLARLSAAAGTYIVDRAIITVPAYFDQPQIEATRRAGELAGLQVIDLLHEPTAAACYYCWRSETPQGTFLVYDLGGGTFDVTVLRCTAGIFEVLGVAGNNYLGGDDLDAALALDLMQRLRKDGCALDLDLKESEDDRLLFTQLRFLAESVKKGLTLANEFVLRDTSLKDQEGTPITVDMPFERHEVEAIFRPLLEGTLPYCHEALAQAQKKAGITLADVDQIILAGGSTHVPLVRELVQQELCQIPGASGPRARCDQPVYDKVDTIVALGAAIRAAAVGGLAVYNPERTVRVSFRGAAVAGGGTTHVGGKVEALAADLDLQGGRVRLRSGDHVDHAALKDGGAFAFRGVPLQAGAENLLLFEVLDRAGGVVATARRPVRQDPGGAARPTGGAGSTAVLSKALLLEVSQGGQQALKELIPATTTLPTNASHEFTHPGDTELLLFPMYHGRRRIKVIEVRVPSSTSRGTPVRVDVNVDQMSFITVKGCIGETTFDAALELPPDRQPPSPEETQGLERKFQEALSYLPAGQKAKAKALYGKAKQRYQDAAALSDDAKAVHEFEEMERLAGDLARAESPLQPPKSEFDELVEQCRQLNQYAAAAAAEQGQPHDHQEIDKNLEAQRLQGERAFAGRDQKAYADTLVMLEHLRNHLIQVCQKLKPIEDPRSDAERATDHVRIAEKEAEKVRALAEARKRGDVQDEIAVIRKRLAELGAEAARNPKGVNEETGKLRARLEQLKNILMGADTRGPGGKLVESV